MESLSSPGKPTSVTTALFDMHIQTLQRLTLFLFAIISSIWEYIFEAHINRRLPKTASTLTVSSDDLDERDMASESGLLLLFNGIS